MSIHSSEAGSLVIHSARIVDEGSVTENGWIRIEDGAVVSRGVGTDWSPADEVVDAEDAAGTGAILSPGFIDIHGHGGAGASYDDGAAAIRTARAMHRAHGTTRAVISLVTASIDDLARSVAAIADLTETDADILGSHLEGPFLDPGHQGAHDPALLRAPVAADVAHLLEAGRGTIRQVTVAPELPGGLDAVRQIVAAGAAAAVGHTDADAATAKAAFDAGASILTHAFNAMPGIHHRAPGPVLAAAADHRVILEAIADGVHLDAHVIKLLFDSAPGRVALVTDAMAAAGSEDGHYDLGSVSVTVENGVARTDQTGSIAGSTLTQDVALQRAVAAGASLPEAVRAVTETPARAIGREASLGRLSPGMIGDAVLLDAELRVARVWVGPRLLG
ncbi:MULTISPECIES: N-acetylglucosamine-6-phosphate deacetylase [unclassified Microbacterium]|uniref:N-acetylglucosamine-6-phosphate deacetylase n=1 Tax=unclassified Microbacterium TaxID=2609290 RepID=UPI000EA96A7E|nr:MULTISPECIES: N-acetylglucosamine-6-phosphate deacetylase [unclassified Microbacterium]MBT2485153.1 N-acetylglucosamine-6-phosphate deacetylase [Microbacterium sp. ISL-108]RKN67990.1 N-acetylglucosamine-6-phosphate deacetylase [Microbacterium sp. CGR2]